MYIPSISNFAFIKIKGISSYIAYFNDVLNNPSKFKVHIFQWTLVLIHRTTSIVDIVYRENTSSCPSKIIIIIIIIFITIIGNHVNLSYFINFKLSPFLQWLYLGKSRFHKTEKIKSAFKHLMSYMIMSIWQNNEYSWNYISHLYYAPTYPTVGPLAHVYKSTKTMYKIDTLSCMQII